MLQFSESQNNDDIESLIIRFDMLQKGADVFFKEENFIELIDYFIIKDEIKKAFTILTKALKIYPESYDIRISEAQLLIESGLNTAAAKKLKELYKKRPNDLGLILLIGINYTKLSITNKAIVFFDKAVSMIEEKSKKVILYSISKTLIQTGRYDIAAYYLTRAYQISPNENYIILDLAFCLERNHNYKKSEKLYKVYLKKNPFSKLAWYNLGVVLSELQKVEEAIQAFDYSIAIDTNFSSPILNKAELYFQTKKYSKAIEDFTKLLELEHSNALALYLRGVSYFKLNKFKNAFKDLKKSLKIQDDNPQAWFYIAAIYYYAQKNKKAKKSLHKALNQDQLNSKYWRLAAKIFRKNKNYLNAEKSLSAAISFDPFIDEYWFAYSELKTKQKKYEEAIKILNTGKDFIEDTVKYLLKLSSLYLLNNDKINAQKSFKNADNLCENALNKFISIHPNKNQISFLIKN